MCKSAEDLIAIYTKRLKKVTNCAYSECVELLSAATGLTKTQILIGAWDSRSPINFDLVEDYISRRCDGEPLSYITGTKGFWKRDFLVTKDTLIPRPETELIVELVLSENSSKEHRVIDLGTGPGTIGVSLAAERPNWKITATDVSMEALRVAKNNSTGLQNINFVQCSWLSPLSEDFDIIVANPPYINDDDPHLKELGYEPDIALKGGKDGLDATREIVKSAKTSLKTLGKIYLEHGHDQKNKVTDIFLQNNFLQLKSFVDIQGNNRIVRAAL